MKLRMSVLALFCALAALPACVAPRASAQDTGLPGGGATVSALGAAVTPTDPLYALTSWVFTRTQLPAAWSAGTGGPVTIAVVDTGVSPVGDLAAGAVLPGYNAMTGTGDVADDNGHGTAVASVIAGRADNGLGSAGVCWDCRILPVKALGADGSGSTASVAAGVDWAVDHGAQIVNLSLGGTQSDPLLADAVAYAESRGVLVVAAAGNGDTSAPEYPADYPGVVSVAASDQEDARASYSNYGGWVQLAAPGCAVAQDVDSTFGVWCGTSIAAPVVAGIAGLALSDAPAASAAQVAGALAAKAAAVPGGYVAHGRVDAAGALQALGVALPALQAAGARHAVVHGRVARDG